MKPLFTEEELKNAKTYQRLPLICYSCQNIFFWTKKRIKEINKVTGVVGKYCSHKCLADSKKNRINVTCSNCNISLERRPCEISQSKNVFCSKSCAATYNNKHKSAGIRRSKLEVWIETELTNLFTNLEIHFNKKTTIGCELDIFIPSLKLAFEINGILHYQKIYGDRKFAQIQKNDENKKNKCEQHGIELYSIDTRLHNHVNRKNSQKYIDYIVEKIKNSMTADEKFVLISGLEPERRG